MSLAGLYSALADPTRLRVLELLHEKPRPVHDLAAAFDISRPAISRHLRVLKEAGLVREVKQGRENVYSFQPAPLKPGSAWLQQHQDAPPAVSGKRLAKVARRKPKPATEVPMAPAPKPAPVARPRPVAEKPAPRSKVATPTPVAPPPAATPQLSFFDL